MTKQIAVISDIHSNAIALEIVLKELINRKITQCIILGDLLTYGTQPNEVIELLLNFKNKVECIFIKGNHEQFYFDIENNINPIKYKMPKFVEESIFWTNDKLKYNLNESFYWNDNCIINNIYFSHANPFDYGNWTYMNKEEDIFSAAISLNNKNMNVGIFGHTHRNKNYIISDNFQKCTVDFANEFKISNDQQLIINTGSIGQPRGSASGFMIINILDNLLQYDYVSIKLDNKLIRDKMINTNLSLETQTKLNSFFLGGGIKL